MDQRTLVTKVPAGFLCLLVVFAVAPAAGAAEPVDVRILFDLGDGTYFWADARILDPTATNASWNATQEAASAAGVLVESTWFSCCGVAVTDVGDRNPPAWPALLVWNRTSLEWEGASEGISTLVLAEGDAIAWYVAGYDPTTYELRRPVPTPLDPFPAAMFRGNLTNAGSSMSQAPDSLALAWQRDVGVREIVSSPAAAYGRLYFTTFDGLIALDAADGHEVWRNPAVPGLSSCAVFDGTLLVSSSNGRFFRVNASDGKELWNTTLVPETQFSGITSSPKVLYDRVFVGTRNESGGSADIVALSLADGSVAWRHPSGSVHLSSPAIAEATLYIGVAGTYNTTTQVTYDPPFGLLALSASDGSERWFFPTNDSVMASPLVWGDRIVFSSKDGNTYAVRLSGQELWRANLGPSVSSPAVGGGAIYVGVGAFGASGRVVALDAAGTTLWSFAPNGPVQASIAYADGKVFFSTNTQNGTIYALNATTGLEVWSFTPMPNEFILGSPVVANGRLYAPSDNGRLYAFGGISLDLIDLNVTAPTALSAGGEATIHVRIHNVAGRAQEAALTVTLPTAVSFANASRTPTANSGGVLTWALGTVPFGDEIEIAITVRADQPEATAGAVQVGAALSYLDNGGVAYAPVLRTATLVIELKESGVGEPVPVAVFVGALVGSLAVAGGLVWWRRRRQPPASP